LSHDARHTRARRALRTLVIRYPSGTIIESGWLIEGGGTLREAQVEHSLAQVEPDEDSRVRAEADRP
jgi:hypothetical protein